MDNIDFKDLEYEKKLNNLISSFNQTLQRYNDVVGTLKGFRESIDRVLPLFIEIDSKYKTNKQVAIMTYGEDFCNEAGKYVGVLEEYDERIKDIMSKNPGIVQIGNSMNVISSSLNYAIIAFNKDKTISPNFNEALYSSFSDLNNYEQLLKSLFSELSNFKKSKHLIESIEYKIIMDRKKAEEYVSEFSKINNTDYNGETHLAPDEPEMPMSDESLDDNFNPYNQMFNTPKLDPKIKQADSKQSEKYPLPSEVKPIMVKIAPQVVVTPEISNEAVEEVKKLDLKKMVAMISATIVVVSGLVIGGIVVSGNNINNTKLNQNLLDKTNIFSIENNIGNIDDSILNVEIANKFLNQESLKGYDISEYSDLLKMVEDSLKAEFDKTTYSNVIQSESDITNNIIKQADLYKNEFTGEHKEDTAKSIYEFLGNIKYSDLASLSAKESFNISVLLDHLKEFGVSVLGTERFIPINIDGEATYMTIGEFETRLAKLRSDSSVELGKAQEKHGVYEEGTAVDYALANLEKSKNIAPF